MMDFETAMREHRRIQEIRDAIDVAYDAIGALQDLDRTHKRWFDIGSEMQHYDDDLWDKQHDLEKITGERYDYEL